MGDDTVPPAMAGRPPGARAAGHGRMWPGVWLLGEVQPQVSANLIRGIGFCRHVEGGANAHDCERRKVGREPGQDESSGTPASLFSSPKSHH